jgi:NAD(P)-dependent dehydrogenase (short-subunit alcohol dehydrogenase family)
MKKLNELISLEGRVALITGGCGHLGQTFAATFMELGADVVLLDIQKEKSVVESLRKEYSTNVISISCDMEQEDEIRKSVASALETFNRLDIVVNNAAFVGTLDLEGWVTSFEKQSPETWRRALEVNLTAPFVLVKSCLEALRSSGNGSIINIGSTYGVGGVDMSLYEGTSMGNPAAYAASKGGLIQFTRWLSTVLAPEIRVNSISPGGIWRDQPDSFHQRYVEKTPLGRMANEEDFKGIIAYLASDASAYVTGQNIMVDGGWSAW